MTILLRQFLFALCQTHIELSDICAFSQFTSAILFFWTYKHRFIANNSLKMNKILQGIMRYRHNNRAHLIGEFQRIRDNPKVCFNNVLLWTQIRNTKSSFFFEHPRLLVFENSREQRVFCCCLTQQPLFIDCCWREKRWAQNWLVYY